MTDPIAATPPNGATPAGNGQVTVPPSTTVPPVTPATGQAPAGVVTLSTEQYRQLERDAARGRSKDRINGASRNRPQNLGGGDGATDDPEKIDLMNRASTAEKTALQFQVKDRVRELLDKPEYKDLPASARNMILKNPAALSSADNLEDAMVDIENFVDEEVTNLRTATPPQPLPGGQPPVQQQPANVQTPPVIGAGSPALSDANQLEDLSKLTGPKRSQAAIRNILRASKGVKQA